MRTTAVSLDIREASVFYGAHRVLDRVSLSAAGGEFFALLGASGCGKTTLLRAILSPEKRNIAMVFGRGLSRPLLCGTENIYGLHHRVGADADAGQHRIP